MPRLTTCRKQDVRNTGIGGSWASHSCASPAVPELDTLLLAACMSVGAAHAGASAYIALMALFGVAPAVMRPTALALNILVAGFTSLRYLWVGLFRWRTLWPFLIGALPFAVLGGAIQLPGQFYRPLVGAILIIASIRLLWPRKLTAPPEPRDPPIVASVAIGGVVGLLSGLTGTGGGIFLSPILLFVGWSDTRAASGVVAAFILCNSIAGLLGNVTIAKSLPADLPIYAAAVLVGAVVGTSLGIKLAAPIIQKMLGVVLIVAGSKLIGVY
jgi:uncharacterized membrane protein YfcA